MLVAGTVIATVLVVGAVAVGAVEQVAFERTVNREVDAELAAPEYASVTPVAVRIEYAGAGPFASPETVTVTASRTTDGGPPSIAGPLAERIRAATGEDVAVRVRFLEYQCSDVPE